jgi:hypothetical protein
VPEDSATRALNSLNRRAVELLQTQQELEVAAEQRWAAHLAAGASRQHTQQLELFAGDAGFNTLQQQQQQQNGAGPQLRQGQQGHYGGVSGDVGVAGVLGMGGGGGAVAVGAVVGPRWVGQFLPTVEIDDWGTFTFVVARLRGRDARQRILIRGRNYGSETQIMEALHAKVCVMVVVVVVRVG